MGCEVCCECGQKFERDAAEEYAKELAEDLRIQTDSDEELEADYDFCPRCLQKAQQEEELLAWKAEVQQQEVELASLKAEVQQLRAQVANVNAGAGQKRRAVVVDLTGEDEVPAKVVKQPKQARTVFVIAKGDWPSVPRSQLVDVSVLGAYSSRELAEKAMNEYLEEGGWEEGYGYHRGESESAIEIHEVNVDEPATD